MDIRNPDFAPREAKLKYLDADYVVLSPGSFVRCALTGTAIPIDDLKYWSVDRQEAYADAETAFKAYLRDQGLD